MSAVPIIEVEPVNANSVSPSRDIPFPVSKASSLSLPRFRRFDGGELELRIELTIGHNQPVIQAWCIGLGPDVHRVCYSVTDAKRYFIESGVPQELRVEALLYARHIYKDDRDKFY